MDIREYFQKEQKGFYNIIAKMLTVERRKQLYDAINDWHESELKLLGIADVVGRSEQLARKSCHHACSPSDFYKGGKCDKMGCYEG